MGEKPRQPVLIGNSEEMLIMKSDDPSLFKISILAINYNFFTLKKEKKLLFFPILLLTDAILVLSKAYFLSLRT